MEDIICGKSAFRFWRTPPQCLIALPSLPISQETFVRRSLPAHPLVVNSLGSPIDLLVLDRGSRTGAANAVRHLWQGTLPKGAVQDSDWCGQITSPAFTLFNLATQMPLTQLVMAMYEMCGYFAVHKPTPAAEALLAQGDYLPPGFGWRRVRGADGRGTSLWQREPLVELDELRAIASETAGHHGYKKFVRAVDCVTGACASPFEVQLSMLLAMPRRLGGYGIALENNKEIRLTQQARKIAPKQRIYADVYLESAAHDKALVLECQGAAVHANEAASLADADRSTALQAMGLDVVLLTYRQIADEARFAAVLQYVFQKLDINLRPKTPRYQEAERILRRELFINWETLGK